jgi:hypothetical protein
MLDLAVIEAWQEDKLSDAGSHELWLIVLDFWLWSAWKDQLSTDRVQSRIAWSGMRPPGPSSWGYVV